MSSIIVGCGETVVAASVVQNPALRNGHFRIGRDPTDLLVLEEQIMNECY